MTGERIPVAERLNAPSLNVRSDQLVLPGRSSPFNSGSRVQRYRPKDLKDVEASRTDRTRFFEETLVRLYNETRRDIPFLFKTADGDLRSLDAGCLGFLYNRPDPDVVFRLDDEGYIRSVRPSAGLRRRVRGPARPEFTQPDLNARGQKPAMAWLIGALELGRRKVTYAEVAQELNARLGLTNVTHHHVGPVIDAMMTHLRTFDPDVPLLNALVMRADMDAPGEGVDQYLVERFSLPRKPRGSTRAHWVETAVNEVEVYGSWAKLFARAYAEAWSPPRPQLDAFDDDGQGDNPKYRDGRPRPEGPEHKRLKQYVCDNPHSLKLGLKDPAAAVEGSLPSGDRLDVEIVDGDRRIGVEVKSIRSGDEDLRRGLFQCVKYKAVMDAQAELAGGRSSEVLLVTERKLPWDLEKIARALGVRRLVIQVNI